MGGLEPGTVVVGPFWSDGRQGVGVVVPRGRMLWTRTTAPYVPVRILNGDRIPGGYDPADLTPVPGLVPA